MNDQGIYSSIRLGLDTGDRLEFAHQDDSISQTIMARTGSYSSHTGMVIRSREFNRVFVIESLEGGPELNRLSTRVGSYNGHVWVCKLRDEYHHLRIKIGQCALDYVDTGYDWIDTGKQLFVRVPPDDERLNCSEFVYFALYNAGIFGQQLLDKAPWPGREMDRLGAWHIKTLIKEAAK